MRQQRMAGFMAGAPLSSTESTSIVICRFLAHRGSWWLSGAHRRGRRAEDEPGLSAKAPSTNSIARLPASARTSEILPRHVSVKLRRTMLVNRSMPDCTVIPELVYEDIGEAAQWLCQAFGFSVRWRVGDHRAQIAVGDGAIAITEARVGQGFKSPDDAVFRQPRAGEVSQSILVRVEDAHAHHERARR